MATHNAPDVFIAGGGLLGWSLAYRLAAGGARVTLADRADPGHATQAGAGIIAPGVSLDRSPEWLALGRLAVTYYDQLVAELADANAGDTGYERAPLLFIARDDAEWEKLPAAMTTIVERRDAGMGNIGEIALIDGAEARALFPPLADLPGAIHLSGAARVNGRLLRDALARAATALGVRRIDGDARLERAGDRIVAAEVAGERIPVGMAAICGGAWSGQMAADLGFELPVAPQRGQIIHLQAEGVETGGWPIIEGFFSHYLLTFPGGRVVAGATRETGSGFDPRLTAGGVRDVLADALSIAPGLGSLTIAEMRVGLRPFCADGLPILGPAPGIANGFLCTGHGPSGLQLGPVSGALVARQMLGEPTDIDLSPFAAGRFAR